VSKFRQAARVDANQPEIVKKLRQIGATVETGKDDILVGYRGKTFWFEIKDEDAVSKKTGKILESEIQDSQKKLRREWRGHYRIVHSFEQIAEEITNV